MTQSVRRAVIDIGTNSVKLLVAEVAEHHVRPVWEGSRQTRLGEGFYETHRLQPGPLARTAKAVAEFEAKAREFASVSVRAIATSAARDAVNSEDLASAVESASGLKLEIISGEQEATWAFQGVSSHPESAREPLLLLEVGGGSTQFILGQGEEKHFLASFRLGTVRLMQRLPHSDPPRAEELTACRKWLADFLVSEVRPGLEPAMQREVNRHPQHGAVQLVGTGGTASILGRIENGLEDYDRDRIESTRITRERMREHTTRLWQLPLEERRKTVGLPPNRADVILMGAAIYEAAMEVFGFAQLRISTRGLRFGAVAHGTVES